jgi:hypothetical protein
MSITREEFDRIRVYRALFATADGRIVLEDLLRNLGTFTDPARILDLHTAKPELVPMFLQGLIILKDLGVWCEDNWSNLIDKMLEVSMPHLDEERTNDGQTTG